MMLIISMFLVGCADYNEIYTGDPLHSVDQMYIRYGSVSRCHYLTAIAVGAAQYRSETILEADTQIRKVKFTNSVDIQRKLYNFDDSFFNEAIMFIEAGFNQYWVDSHSDLNGDIHVMSIINEVRDYCNTTTPPKKGMGL